MATSVPACSATSKASPNAPSSTFQPKKARASTRCAELDTGRNSVSPCTTPSSAAASQSTNGYEARRSRLPVLRAGATGAAGAVFSGVRPCQMTTIAAAMNTLE